MNFSKDFIWGVATASYQIEGGIKEDGKQETVWDDFCNYSNKTMDGGNGDVACDTFHRYKEDIGLIKNLGAQVYRFSSAMTRVLTYQSSYGTNPVKGTVNEKGLDYYERTVDECLAAGIEPWLTLYHWDLPLELERKGGFRNRDIMYWMQDYADLMTRRLGDRVKHFITHNEMPCILGGYNGWMAPGLQVNLRETLNIVHNMLLSHGTMTKAIRSNVKDAQIGIAHCGPALFPASESAEDMAAFNKCMESFEYCPETNSIGRGTGMFMADNLTYYCDAIYKGAYPEYAFETFKGKMPEILDGDMELISQPLDFHGQNIYTGRPVKAGSKPGANNDGFHVEKSLPGCDMAATKWPITPQSMDYFVNYIYSRYRKPIVITENGMSGADVVCLDGKVHDELRIDFTTRYLEGLSRAIEKGADIRGYFHWSLLDNFEWARGYTERFGLVHVDYQTLKRTPKESYYWYRDLIKKFRNQ